MDVRCPQCGELWPGREFVSDPDAWRRFQFEGCHAFDGTPHSDPDVEWAERAVEMYDLYEDIY